MAARSPIVLESSPHFRAPSITPQQSRRSNQSTADSSSPGLPSPSTLFKPIRTGIKSGSRAQQLPKGAATGFASAASLFKTQRDGQPAEVRRNDNAARAHDASAQQEGLKKVTGKLSKPKKAVKSRLKEDRQPSPLQTYAYQDTPRRKESTGSLPSLKSPSTRHEQHATAANAAKPALSLSEYDFVAEEMPPPAKPVHPAKKVRKPRAKTDKPKEAAKVTKPRKQSTKAADDSGDAPPKKPKKRFTKSESIILNSDEPDEVLDAGTNARDNTMRSHLPDISAFAHAEDHRDLNEVDTAQTDTVDTTKAINETAAEKSAYFDNATTKTHEHSEAKSNDGALKRPQPLATRPNDFNNEDSLADTTEPGKLESVSQLSAPHETPKPMTSPQVPQRSLTDAVSGFGYAEHSLKPAQLQRTESGEALTKRRRIELADVATVAPAMRKAAEEPAPEPVKKTKAVKKRPQTITDLATKAYRAPNEEATDVPALSEFFAPQKANAAADTTIERPTDAVNPKKPRKPRMKKADTGEPVKTKKAEKPARAKKTKPKTDEAASVAKLYSPGAARTVEQDQAFLFGTSSQLATEESLTFDREMQIALEESEVVGLPKHSRKSRSKVMSVPEGTNLSIGQAHRDLWCTASRDSVGDTLQSSRIKAKSLSTARIALMASAATSDAIVQPLIEETKATYVEKQPPLNDPAWQPEVPPSLRDRSRLPEDFPPPTSADREVVDLSNTSPLAAIADAPPPGAIHPPSEAHAISSLTPEDDTEPELPAMPRSDDDWMMLNSDSSAADDIGTSDTKPIAVLANDRPVLLRPPQLPRAATSPTRLRTALSDLDTNIGMLARTSPVKDATIGQRPFTTNAVVEQPKRPRGRPRKDASITMAAPGSPRSPKRRRRPAKAKVSAADARSGALRTQSAKLGMSASQPTTSAEFVNIDEISDSEPTTPSPPRRRATSSPPAILPLNLAVFASPSIKAKAPAIVTSTLKPGDTNWPSIQDKLFPHITTAVRSTPPSSDTDQPTWHEKILLYDPIVLEDFTAWLNEQEICIESQRLKPKAKTKGRKKKDEGPAEPEYETVKEELQPWMVQKWCEEKSICCLWKEGLRGGVRTRY